MTKNNPVYICVDCGWETSKWQGQCKQCKAWGSLEEENEIPERKTKIIAPTTRAIPITQIDTKKTDAKTTGISEVDRVLGRGIVPGAVILLAGDPGVGKSTLLMEIALKIASIQQNKNILYISGEESINQITMRAKRIGKLQENLLLASENNLSIILGHIEQTQANLVIIDSIQTIADPQINGMSGSTLQVKTVTNQLISVAKTRNIPIILIGHVTKDGTIAGPKVLEHLVDVVCQFEGEKFGSIRMLRSIKNRFGPTDEVGCFEITETGMKELKDPSGLFISQNRTQTPGTCIAIAMDGKRPIPIEIQSLVVDTNYSVSKRVTSGFDNSRTSMMLAVLQSRANINMQNMDVYVGTVGGAKINDIALDLGIILSLTSAKIAKTIDMNLACFGEVGLTGDIRKITGAKKRIKQALQLGFTKIILPKSNANELKNIQHQNTKNDKEKNIELIYVSNVQEAISKVFQK